jgi:thioredoxin-like negative regulator of GroEL
MKLIVLSFLISLFLFVSSVSAQQINWLTDYKTAQKIAAETGQPMLLDFTADWCKPCREMEIRLWSRADVIEIASRFVCVKIDFDKDKNLVNKYGVGKLPHVFTTDSWGAALNFHRGFSSNAETEIIENLLAVPKDFTEIKEARERLASNKNNLNALAQIADFYQQRKFYYLSSEFYNRMLKLEKDHAKREMLMLLLAENYFQVGWNSESKKMFEAIKKEFPNSEQTEKINRYPANL